MPSICIRPAQRSDAPAIHQFIVELAIYEKAAHEVESSVADIERSLFDQPMSSAALMCEVDGQIAGFAVYFANYSTWLGHHGIYLEDLYVSPVFRGLGAGRALLHEVAKIAVSQGCRRMEWSVLNWNTPAIRVYDAIGGVPQSEWTRYRLAGDALLAFAESGKTISV
ncbi:GNAT family N-acetyltransferase [Allopusillimonas ginsengisoli]|uniref:GNAT family N-acetyltransferase n=1 Tax=Allopusillimonas ginsengisoli TaxID=453575 RepID=UPI00101F68B7|nr:GNAT family N-acetyltransferase [Allopusillimonas ginsengisoli]TEA74292.1 GNAT family N-acetyltransferase [Allopusillimonas ginsengisoli]